jgi:hypothetical protein
MYFSLFFSLLVGGEIADSLLEVYVILISYRDYCLSLSLS